LWQNNRHAARRDIRRVENTLVMAGDGGVKKSYGIDNPPVCQENIAQKERITAKISQFHKYMALPSRGSVLIPRSRVAVKLCDYDPKSMGGQNKCTNNQQHFANNHKFTALG
jgi:hypothetical protein